MVRVGKLPSICFFYEEGTSEVSEVNFVSSEAVISSDVEDALPVTLCPSLSAFKARFTSQLESFIFYSLHWKELNYRHLSKYSLHQLDRQQHYL